jgi:hypothetical protein
MRPWTYVISVLKKSFAPTPVRKETWKETAMSIPQDPVMLLSYVNTQLRDHYETLEELCSALSIDRAELEEKLRGIDYTYDPAANAFL